MIDEPVLMCGKGLHPLEGTNLIINKATGRRACRACRNEWQRKNRAKTCPQGHDLRSPTSYTLSASGKRRKCIACQRIRRAEQAAKDASPFYGRTSMKPAVSPGKAGGEAGARLRLALMVQARYAP
jgi:hypothetical protein